MTSVPRMNIYGDSSRWLVVEGIKQLTIRLDDPKYSVLLPETHFVVDFEQGQEICTVFSRQIKPLKDFTQAELLLDGYMSTEEAAKDLATYPRYEGVTKDTPMLGIGFTTNSRLWAYLTKETQKLLLATPLSQAILIPEFHGLFLPSYLWWVILKSEDEAKELRVSDWHYLLSDHLGIFDSDFLEQVCTLDQSTKDFYQTLTHEKIVAILKYESTVSTKYKSLVLCQPVSVKA